MELKKQLRPHPYTVNEIPYSVTPFSAMDSIVVLGDIIGLISPALAGMAPAFLANKGGAKEKLANISIDELVDAISRLNGKNIATLAKELLIDYGNVVFHDPEDPNRSNYQVLDMDSFNEIFCLDLASVLELCGFVIKMNYGNFFGGAVSRFGKAMAASGKAESANTVNSAATSSATT